MKEKCEGGFPCSRCLRLQRTCLSASATSEAAPNEPHLGRKFVFSPLSVLLCRKRITDVPSSPDGFFDEERIKAMETLLRHYTGSTLLDRTTLMQLADSVRAEHNTVAQTTPIDVGSSPVEGESSNEDEDQIVDGTTAGKSDQFSHQ